MKYVVKIAILIILFHFLRNYKKNKPNTESLSNNVDNKQFTSLRCIPLSLFLNKNILVNWQL